MIAATLLSTLATAQLSGAEPTNSDVVFACQYFRNDHEASDGSVHVVDLRVVRRGDSTWTLEWENKTPVVATAFPAEFGSVGGSVGLQWHDAKGKQQRAYISFSDIHDAGGKEYFWLNLKRPSLWQAPGYGCESQSGTSK